MQSAINKAGSRWTPQTWSGTCEGRSEHTDRPLLYREAQWWYLPGSRRAHIFHHAYTTVSAKQSIIQNPNTYNYGVEDYNTQLIADQGEWPSQSDVLILYIEVNDVLSKRHTKAS